MRSAIQLTRVGHFVKRKRELFEERRTRVGGRLRLAELVESCLGVHQRRREGSLLGEQCVRVLAQAREFRAELLVLGGRAVELSLQIVGRPLEVRHRLVSLGGAHLKVLVRAAQLVDPGAGIGEIGPALLETSSG